MLELKHITYTVSTPEGEQTILNDISIDIPDRKLIVFTGPNGGGKTTLAKVIMGLVTPTGGQILFNGQDITHLGITERARLGISYGFQQPPRFKGITVRNLLTIASGDANLSKDKCCKYLTQVGLCANDYLDREVDVSLSGGEVKRIEIATLLARGSELMIFDEPEAGIDLWSFARLTETFGQLRQRELATMIIISHQERIIQLADEIVVVGGGELKHRGSTEEIFPLIMVYNDFYVGENCDVDIVAGCGIHNSGCNESRHDGVHTFYVSKNSHVRYVEKHYGEGDGSGTRVMNPTTIVYLDEGASIQMETVQIRGIDSTVRKTKIVCGKGAEAVITERLLTHGKQHAESDMEIELNGEDARGRVISRSVAQDESKQIFHPVVVGNSKCFGHVQCDSIIMGKATIESIPAITANSTDAQLIHEAAIGKIAGDQLLKLQTLGLTEEEAEDTILKGFLA